MQNSSLYYPGPLYKISLQSINNFLSNVAYKQTDEQTNATKNITSFTKEVTILGTILPFASYKHLIWNVTLQRCDAL